MRKKVPELEEALLGRFGSHHALMVATILAKIDFLDGAIDALSAEIDKVIAPFEPEVQLSTPSPVSTSAPPRGSSPRSGST